MSRRWFAHCLTQALPRLHLFSAADDKKIVSYLHIDLFSYFLHRRCRVSPRRHMYLLIVGSHYCVMRFAYALHMHRHVHIDNQWPPFGNGRGYWTSLLCKGNWKANAGYSTWKQNVEIPIIEIIARTSKFDPIRAISKEFERFRMSSCEWGRVCASSCQFKRVRASSSEFKQFRASSCQLKRVRLSPSEFDEFVSKRVVASASLTRSRLALSCTSECELVQDRASLL